ncbi:TIGR01777 family oxidoreductase [Hyunsoonleella ulvae]|uniref:TIGR01777 family oxidoreductase n=1 Tax=Hyunsoonleella ulvae TaxID=2799948 RepID=UPI0019399886|nr:TIGR01777 family oxidoreductase [Hyunsoonleella ulvae]
MRTIIIAGGSGFLGQVLNAYFIAKNYNVKILTRNPKQKNDILWDGKNLGTWTEALEGSEALINLTGKSVNCRYTKKNKKLIHDSRIESTHILGLAINLCKKPPKVWLNSSTATIYRNSYDKKMCEINGEIGDDFSMNIAKSWESVFKKTVTAKTRKVILRTSIVLGKNGGALIPLKNLVRFGFGGKQGSGKQKVSWIHESDFCEAINFLIRNKDLDGVFNLCVPEPIDNFTLMRTLRKVMKVSFGISHPISLLNLGAKIIGTETELILKSRYVIPKRLLNNGFVFEYPNIEKALLNLKE